MKATSLLFLLFLFSSRLPSTQAETSTLIEKNYRKDHRPHRGNAFFNVNGWRRPNNLCRHKGMEIHRKCLSTFVHLPNPQGRFCFWDWKNKQQKVKLFLRVNEYLSI